MGNGHNTQCPKNVAAAHPAAILPHLFNLFLASSESSPPSPSSTALSNPASRPLTSTSNANFSRLNSLHSHPCPPVSAVMASEYGSGATVAATVPYMHGSVAPVEAMETVP